MKYNATSYIFKHCNKKGVNIVNDKKGVTIVTIVNITEVNQLATVSHTQTSYS